MKTKLSNFISSILFVVLIVFALFVAVFFLGGCNEEQQTVLPNPDDSEIVLYLKDQLSQTQEQLTDANVLLQSYLSQIEESNQNNADLTEQNRTLNSTIQSLQETVASLTAEVQRLTALLEAYGDIANGTWEVHFYNGDELVKLLLIRNNTKITETVTAEKEGFDFLGWATAESGQVVNYQDIEITQATNFYAVFERITGLFSPLGVRLKTWQELQDQGYIQVSKNIVTKATKTQQLDGVLIMPDEIIRIEKEAFYDAQNLVKVECHGVTTIGSSAFRGCYKLLEVQYSDKLTSFGGLMGICPFSMCYNLRTLTIPETITSVDQFWNSGGIFNGLIEVINNSSLSEQEIYEVISSDPLRFYKGVHSGESRIKLIDGVAYYITDTHYVAIGCASMSEENIEILDDCTEIIDYAFTYSTQLHSVKYGKNLGSVSYRAFSYCSGLKSIYFPLQIDATDFDGDAFIGCKETLIIYFEVTDAKTYHDSFSVYDPNDSSKHLQCKENFSYEDYLADIESL